jgi:tRNA threonylcarbamoyladenosine biosynthesis protein TsaE
MAGRGDSGGAAEEEAAHRHGDEATAGPAVRPGNFPLPADGETSWLFLPDEAATLALGRALALSMPEDWASPCALLRAALGSGKTTLARGFTSSLPGAELAEVASPSFNLVNVYPTRPPVVHADLYRLGEGFADASLEEALEAGSSALACEPRRALLVEWAEYMPEELIPGDRLDISLTEKDGGREALLTAAGPHARQWLHRTLSTFLQSGKS